MFNFTPAPQVTVGESIGRGIESAGASIGAALAEMGRRRKELSGYKTLLEAYAEDPANGINKDQIDKMSLEQAKSSILAAEVRKSRAQATQQQSALANFFSNVNDSTNPKPDLMATLARGMGPTQDKVTTPPAMDLRSAIINAAARNPAILQTDNPASKMFGSAIAAALKAPQGNPQLDPSGKFYMSETGWKPLPASSTRTGTVPQPRPNPAAVLEPDVELAPYVPAGGKEPVPGLYQKMKDGKRVGWYQETQSAPRVDAANGRKSFMDLINAAGGDGGGTTEIPTVGSQEDYDQLESGAQYYDPQGNLRTKK